MRLTYRITEADQGRRAGRVAAQVFDLSAGDLARLKRENGLMADGQPCRQTDRVRAGQLLAVDLPDRPASPGETPGWIVYEDAALCIIDKPAGLPTMRSGRGDASLQQLYEAQRGPFRPVSRLDKGTGGLMAAAATGYTQHLLSGALHTDRMIREYYALVAGRMIPDAGRIDLPIGRRPGSVNLRAVSPDGKPSVTWYRTVWTGQTCSCLRLRLLTGRTHQIRVHLSALGHPIIGDPLYGAPSADFPDALALHSAYLFLTHPLTGERLAFRSLPDWAAYITAAERFPAPPWPCAPASGRPQPPGRSPAP